ncbi:MAG: agmatinase [Candidatus Thiodiazotropha sp.]|jgi:agmatinase
MNQSMHYLSLPNSSIEAADVLILPVPYERTVTYQSGTHLAPEAILAASAQLEFYEEDRGWSPSQYMKTSVLPEVQVKATSEQAFHQHLFDVVNRLPGDNLLIALGGEHSITPAMVFARMPSGGTVVQIDAHADLRPSYHGSIYNHACPMYRLWQKGYRLIQIGIRSLNANEAERINNEPAITTYFDRQLQQLANWQMLLAQLAMLKGPVWLTIDMDGFDPSQVPGVGTPQPGGLSWHQGLTLLEVLTGNKEIELSGIDILELIPEANRHSDMFAAKLMQKCISYWGMAQGFDQNAADGSQLGVEDE